MSNSRKPKAAPKAVLNISHLATKEKVAAALAITNTATTAAAVKSSPALQQALKSFAAAHDDVQTALANHDAAKKAWMSAEQDLLQKEGSLVAAGNLYRDAVNATPGMDEATIASLGLKVSGPKGAAKVMTAPANVAARAGKQAGEVDLRWKPVDGAKTYLVQTTDDPAALTGWADAAAVTRAKVALKGLTSGKRMWVRVATVGSNGQSAYGSPVAASVA
ncbi:MAG TPA: hypothetical protein VFF73_24485 [Planctomycetota bacterium]|nr:hypothetical protein [Planctomycetota bacterium]